MSLMNHTTMTPNMIMQKSVNWYGVVYRGTRDRNNQRILTGNRYYFVTKILCYLNSLKIILFFRGQGVYKNAMQFYVRI